MPCFLLLNPCLFLPLPSNSVPHPWLWGQCRVVVSQSPRTLLDLSQLIIKWTRKTFFLPPLFQFLFNDHLIKLFMLPPSMETSPEVSEGIIRSTTTRTPFDGDIINIQKRPILSFATGPHTRSNTTEVATRRMVEWRVKNIQCNSNLMTRNAH